MLEESLMTGQSGENISAKVDDVITQGSTWAAIWHMSWPLVMNMATISVASFCDVWVAGKLGSNAQAAIGIGGQIWFFMILLSVALATGTTALVSRYWGAGDRDTTIEAARQSLIFSVIFGLTSATVGVASCRFLLRALGASPEVEQLGWEYLRFELAAQFIHTILWVTNSIFRAKGNARIPMGIMALVTVLVITGEIGLCIWPFQIGISGIGISWMFAVTVGLIIELAILKRSDMGECLSVNGFRESGISRSWIKRILNIGIPTCIQDSFWVGTNFVLFLILAKTMDPTSAQAAWAIGIRLEEIGAGMPIYALSMAVATIVGQNLGANKPDRAEIAGWQVAFIGALFNTLVGAILFFYARQIAGFMTADPPVIEYSAQYLKVLGLSCPFISFWLVLFGAMQGAGYTRWPMWATAVLLIGVRVPLAWYLTVEAGLGPLGTWISLASTTVLVGFVAMWRFSTGIWKRQKV